MRLEVGPFVERHGQFAAIDAAIENSRAREGQLLIFEGALGLGKTALLNEAKKRALTAGFTLLHARGSEFEAGFPYGVVRQLFEPWLATADEAERKAVLSGPAKLAAPLFEYGTGGVVTGAGPEQRQAVLHGLYWMCVHLARRAPLLLLLDDLHWADVSSLQFLTYMEGRLDGHAILMCAATESVDDGQRADINQALLSSASARLVAVGPLSEDGVRAFAAGALPGVRLDETLVRVCYAATGGNPFFLRELLAEVREEELGDPLSLARVGPRNIARVVLRRLQQLPQPLAEHTTRLARALAVLDAPGEPALGHAAHAAHAAHVAGLDAVEAAEAVSTLMDLGIVHPLPPLRFAQPVVRTAIYEHLPLPSRHRAHARAAKALHAAGATGAQVVPLLVPLPPSGDEWTATVLADAGREALEAGDPAAAARLLRRALDEPAPAALLPALLARLGAAELRLRDPEATARLGEALELTEDPLDRAAIVIDMSTALTAAARYEDALALLQQAHAAVRGRSREVELRLHSEIVKVAQLTPRTRPLAARELSRLDRTVVGEQGATAALVGAQQAFEALIGGERAPDVLRTAEAALLHGPLTAPPDGGAQASWLIALVLACCDRLPEADRLLDEALRDAEEQSMLLATADLRALHAWLRFQRGMLAEAETDGSLALGSTEEAGTPPTGMPFAAGALIDSLVAQGQIRTAARVVDRCGLDSDISRQPTFLPLVMARGRLRIAQGDAEAGVRDLLGSAEALTEWGTDCPALSPTATAAATLARMGRTREARPLAEETLATARRFGTPRTVAGALVATGLAEEGRARLRHLEEAVALLEDSPAALERCLALTEYGAALRRADRAEQARPLLRRAGEIADATGAAALAKRIRGELAAMGVRARVPARTGVSGLTPRERSVSALAAEGKRNQEIARMLFVTVKTVEWHLGQAYRKLGIASRGELRDALARV
ncbi:AAA family ATPase [Streptomyces pactum]|uniref:AAA family ATPase n=1 Tax=Streptomyces pactum TaxID=68249 RepID=A0ABS0NTI8_9ACTN|nr:LuxR family transcriptional regulator [Streptomyces pactum]MBH5338511.1 AAA family ATPase [Streptomyces pactum]